MVVTAVGGPGCTEEEMTLVIGDSEHTLHREAAEGASNFVAKKMVHSEAMSQDRKGIRLAVGALVYLDAEEMRVQGWWRRMQGRLLRGIRDELWRRVQLASYLGLQSKAVRCFCRHALAVIGDSREEATETERTAMDRLYPQMVRELLAQSGKLSINCDGDSVRLVIGQQNKQATRLLSKDRYKIRRTVFCFDTWDEVDETAAAGTVEVDKVCVSEN